MYKIEKKDYGIKTTFLGIVTVDEMTSWLNESRLMISSFNNGFGALIDMSETKPMLSEAQEKAEEGQKLYAAKGMIRSAVIVSNPILQSQFKRVAMETGIYSFERYLNSSSNPNWEAEAIKWIVDAIDPDF